ncbi:MAG: TRAP transporter small permease [Deltaproteobacteria bacterium]|nr:TRAP transporter small permease [Deltaproteobacteria bacterium]MBW2154503.1 TRAP transporter small permease [Deltaproteobacteria bacterium]
MKAVAYLKYIIGKGDFLFNSIGRIIGVLCTVLIILTLSAGVISRYVFDKPFFWTDEVARILLLWSVFIGAAMGFRKGASTVHIGLDYFVSLFPEKLQKPAVIFRWIVNLFFCMLMFVIGTMFFIQTITFRTAALDISKGYIYICLPIFAIMTFVFLINQWSDK